MIFLETEANLLAIFDNNEICSIFDSLVFYVWGQNFDFLRKMDQFQADLPHHQIT